MGCRWILRAVAAASIAPAFACAPRSAPRAPAAPVQDPAQTSFAAALKLASDDPQRGIGALREYLAQYGEGDGEAERELHAWLAIGHVYRTLDQREEATRAYEMVATRFHERGLQPNTRHAAVAAEASFELGMDYLHEIEQIELPTEGAEFRRQAQALFHATIHASSAFDQVYEYRVPYWKLTAMYHRGLTFETVAIKVRRAPLEARDESAAKAYHAVLDGQMQPFEGKAVALYRETVKLGESLQISNEWTQKARERLRAYETAAPAEEGVR